MVPSIGISVFSGVGFCVSGPAKLGAVSGDVGAAASAGVLVPWAMYRCYADRSGLDPHVTSMGRWVDAVVASNETRETWNTLLESMTSYGLRVSPEDRAKILDYLATALGPKPGSAP